MNHQSTKPTKTFRLTLTQATMDAIGSHARAQDITVSELIDQLLVACCAKGPNHDQDHHHAAAT